MGEIEEIINKLRDQNNNIQSAINIETLILNILTMYSSDQGKDIKTNLRVPKKIGYLSLDAYLPEGIDNCYGGTVVDVKSYIKIESVMNFFSEDNNLFQDLLETNVELKNIICIFTMDIEDAHKQKLLSKLKSKDINVVIWGMSDLERISSDHIEDINKISKSLSVIMLESAIVNSVNNEDDDWRKRNEIYIEGLKKKYYDDNLVMFLGAGTSKDAEIPTWNELIFELIVSLISENSKHNFTNEEKKFIVSKIKNMNLDSPLLEARYVEKGLRDGFIDKLTELLYKRCINTSNILEEITQLCIPIRGGIGIRAVVTYNFDDLLEYNLNSLGITHRSIYTEEVPLKHELGVYHVHGFLPRDRNRYKDLSKWLLVFSEAGYHSLILDPYNWANIVQLNYLRENTCLFIGMSMTDPNLRRLLDIAAVRRQENDNLCKHYAILKKEEFKVDKLIDSNIDENKIKVFEKANRNIMELSFKELGINIIWIEDFKEIPGILKKIKE
ncbi:SIR2 family protein [Clostridium sp. 19966]|uniref:SIR2 family protein n=1 Tax=Clostridium sp. 19966 TaxID=2768166 RepID=UPI0028DDA492|nr:SIR2 family protein [Clostridium sp. 19966]MDT8719038.1 SIR2 family protein [Clostridium sp. 19966]